ncbi:Sulfotransferase domain [Sesbania bispinosa]|nr:Sulfotransferase domain [Sesbania bispinosa]
METKDPDQDIKPSKKFPLTLRLVVLVIAVLCGIYICSICLEQKGIHTNAKLLDEHGVFKKPCSLPSNVEQWEVPYLHYPQPETYNREECACNPVRFFCIVSMQRSGSGWFETFLNSHINISSNGEIFSVGNRRENVSSILNIMDKVYNLDWFTSASKNECSAAVGFKWMLNQGLMENHKEIVEYFERRRVSAIFLFRRNILRRMVSVLANSYDKDAKPLNGTHKSHVHSMMEAKILARYRPRINITLLIPELKQTEETAAKAIAYFKNTRHIVLYYEDLVNNRTKLKDVQEFLRVPYRDLESRQVKIHTGSLSKQIQNWDEVQKALTGTPYQSFLYNDH